MIAFDYITAWRREVPWVDDAQVEQDLVISRAVVEIFSHPLLADALALRGGTALSKLHLRPPARFSEDIDLVQTTAQPAGPMTNALREVLEPWLGKPKWKQGEGRVTFYFRYTAEGALAVPMRLKVETNTREHFSIHGLRRVPFAVASRWFEGTCQIQTRGRLRPMRTAQGASRLRPATSPPPRTTSIEVRHEIDRRCSAPRPLGAAVSLSNGRNHPLTRTGSTSLRPPATCA